VDDLIDRVCETALTEEQIVLLGFSQGACLVTEYAARHPQRYGGVVGLSGGLIGPEGTDFDYEGTLDDTPVFLGCSDQDPYIPLERVKETAEVLRRLSAKVTKRIYEGMGHNTNEDETDHVRDLLRQSVDLTSSPSEPADEDESDDE
jgi:phospholipase/carboxylesterase